MRTWSWARSIWISSDEPVRGPLMITRRFEAGSGFLAARQSVKRGRGGAWLGACPEAQSYAISLP